MNKLVLISDQADVRHDMDQMLRDEDLAVHQSELNSGMHGVAAKKLLSLVSNISQRNATWTHSIELQPLVIIGVLAFDQFQGVETMSLPDQGSEDPAGLYGNSMGDFDFTPDLNDSPAIGGLFGAAESETAHLHLGYNRLVELLPRQLLAIRMLDLFSFMYPSRVIVKSMSCGVGEIVLFCPYLKEGVKKRKEKKQHPKQSNNQIKVNVMHSGGHSMLLSP